MLIWQSILQQWHTHKKHLHSDNHAQADCTHLHGVQFSNLLHKAHHSPFLHNLAESTDIECILSWPLHYIHKRIWNTNDNIWTQSKAVQIWALHILVDIKTFFPNFHSHYKSKTTAKNFYKLINWPTNQSKVWVLVSVDSSASDNTIKLPFQSHDLLMDVSTNYQPVNNSLDATAVCKWPDQIWYAHPT